MGPDYLVPVMIKNTIRLVYSLFYKINFKVLKLKSCFYRSVFMSCGENFKIWGKCYIKNPQKICIGNNVSINDGAYLNGLGGIRIGNDVSISACSIIVSTLLDTKEFLNNKKHVSKEIVIGNNVQIGAGSIILAGVEIGDNVIVGAGSVVTKSLKSNQIVTGIPASNLRNFK